MQLARRAQPRPRLVPLLVVVALTVAAWSRPGSFPGSRRHVPPPFGLAANGRIAFVSDGKVVTENPDGTATVTVRQGSTPRQAPTYSDGTKIVYKNVLRANTIQPIRGAGRYHGRRRREVANGRRRHDVSAGNPVLSPDGRWISYSAADDHAYVAGGRIRQPTDIGNIKGGAWTPSWSTDNERLAVAGGNGVL